MAGRNLPGQRSPTTGEAFAIGKTVPGLDLIRFAPRWTGRVELIESQLEIPLRWRKPKRIFVDSMSDLFHEALPIQDLERIWRVVLTAAGRGHTMMILTKRAARMAELVPILMHRIFGPHWIAPERVWLGVSVEDHKNKDRIDILRETPAALRFLSLEPLLEDLGELDLRGISWVIIGGESGPSARPTHPDWFRAVRDKCQAAAVPFFFKQWGEHEAILAACRGLSAYADDPALLRDAARTCTVVWPDGRRETPEASLDYWDRDFDEGGDTGFDGSDDPANLFGCAVIMRRVGKKRAGRLLDGRTWDEIPGSPEGGGDAE